MHSLPNYAKDHQLCTDQVGTNYALCIELYIHNHIIT